MGSTNISAGWSRCAPCSNPPTRRLPGASSRFSAAACLRIIRGFFASAGCRGSTERSVPTTRPRRSMMASPAIRSDLSRRMAASLRRPRANSISRSSFPPNRKLRWFTGWIIRPSRYGGRRWSVRGTMTRSRRYPPNWFTIRMAAAASTAITINAYPPELGPGGPQYRFVPDYSSAPQTPQSMQDFATGTHWSGALRIGDATWQVQAIPAAGGRLIARYDRALIVLTAGLIITIFVAVYLGLASRNSRQLALANRRVLELAQTDILTGLPN